MEYSGVSSVIPSGLRPFSLRVIVGIKPGRSACHERKKYSELGWNYSVQGDRRDKTKKNGLSREKTYLELVRDHIFSKR